MAVTTNAPENVKSYILNCTGEDADLIMKLIKSLPARKAARDARYGLQSIIDKCPLKLDHQNKIVKPTGGANKHKRPLNSFMAYRKYYSGALSPHPQKAISKFITVMWRQDPFEAKWALLAKAYTIVRGDDTKAGVTISEFFEICAPLVGVIPPYQYMAVMGWELNGLGEGEQVPKLTRLFVPELERLPQEFTTSLLSVDDLVKHCADLGFLPAIDATKHNAADSNGALTMVVQPTDLARHHNQAVTEATEHTSNISLDLTGLPIGAERLTHAMMVAGTGADKFAAFFDPAGDNYDLAYDPFPADKSAADRGMFDAYDIADLASIAHISHAPQQMDISEFVHDLA